MSGFLLSLLAKLRMKFPRVNLLVAHRRNWIPMVELQLRKHYRCRLGSFQNSRLAQRCL